MEKTFGTCLFRVSLVYDDFHYFLRDLSEFEVLEFVRISLKHWYHGGIIIQLEEDVKDEV